MARKKKKSLIRRPYLKKVNRVKQSYKPEDVLAAMHAIWKGMSRRQAAKQYNIPRSTLLDKLDGKRPVEASPGPNPFLTKAEERLLESWVMDMYQRGFPLKCEDLKDMAQSFIQNNQRRTSFKNGRPGRSWMRNFLLRHPHVYQIGVDPARKGRSVTTREEARVWCQQLRNFLASISQEDILDDPEGSRVFNVDHGEFLFDVNSAAFVEHRQIDDDPKDQRTDVECVSVVANFSASGKVAPLMFVYPKRELPDEVVQTFPADWVGTHSDRGSLTGKTFADYIVAFHRWLTREEIQLPVVLLLDGRRSRLNLGITKFCEENGIIVYCLFPTPRPAIAELFSAVFDSSLHDPNQVNGHSGSGITKYNFALRLKEALSVVDEDASKSVFEVYGILPYLQNLVQTLNEVKADFERDCEPDFETDCELTPIEGEIEVEFPISQDWGNNALASFNHMLKSTTDNGGIIVSPPVPNYYMVQLGSDGQVKHPSVVPLNQAMFATKEYGSSELCPKSPSEGDSLPDLTSQLVVKPILDTIVNDIENVDEQIDQVLHSIMKMESEKIAVDGACPSSPASDEGTAGPFRGFAVSAEVRKREDARVCLKKLESYLSSKELLPLFNEASKTRQWSGDSNASLLFDFWLNMSDESQGS